MRDRPLYTLFEDFEGYICWIEKSSVKQPLILDPGFLLELPYIYITNSLGKRLADLLLVDICADGYGKLCIPMVDSALHLVASFYHQWR